MDFMRDPENLDTLDFAKKSLLLFAFSFTGVIGYLYTNAYSGLSEYTTSSLVSSAYNKFYQVNNLKSENEKNTNSSRAIERVILETKTDREISLFNEVDNSHSKSELSSIAKIEKSDSPHITSALQLAVPADNDISNNLNSSLSDFSKNAIARESESANSHRSRLQPGLPFGTTRVTSVSSLGSPNNDKSVININSSPAENSLNSTGSPASVASASNSISNASQIDAASNNLITSSVVIGPDGNVVDPIAPGGCPPLEIFPLASRENARAIQQRRGCNNI